MNTQNINWFDPKAYGEFFKAGNMQNVFSSFQNMGGLDTQALASAQQKNMQAFVEANRVAAEGFQHVFQKQLEVARENFDIATKALRDSASQPMNADAAGKQAQIAQESFQRAISNAHELAETARQANEKALGVVAARYEEGMAELQDMAKQAQAQAKGVFNT